MVASDAYGRVTIDANNTSSFRAWAITKLGKIDPDWIFETEDYAKQRAALECDDQSSVIAVIVTGDRIDRA